MRFNTAEFPNAYNVCTHQFYTLIDRDRSDNDTHSQYTYCVGMISVFLNIINNVPFPKKHCCYQGKYFIT